MKRLWLSFLLIQFVNISANINSTQINDVMNKIKTTIKQPTINTSEIEKVVTSLADPKELNIIKEKVQKELSALQEVTNSIAKRLAVIKKQNLEKKAPQKSTVTKKDDSFNPNTRESKKETLIVEDRFVILG